MFQSRDQWQAYAVNALQTVERLAGELGIADRLHLWPDKSLGRPAVARHLLEPQQHLQWLNRWWTRVSEWPRPTTPSSQSK